MGKVRRMAVNDVRVRGMSYAQVALKYGVTKSAVCKWVQRASDDHREFIETRSSRPYSHPNQLDTAVIRRIIELREKYNRCAPVLHAYLQQEGVEVSLSSVGRVLKRCGLTRKKKPAKWGKKIPRPEADTLGALVQADTMHVVRRDTSRYYIYAVIDTYSRYGYAEYRRKGNQKSSIQVVKNAKRYCGFDFVVVQTDNGAEFKNTFEYQLSRVGMKVRHSRVRTPNDNAHVERFIRTIQDECFNGKDPKERCVIQELNEYLEYYNKERLHLSLDLVSPATFVSKLLN